MTKWQKYLFCLGFICKGVQGILLVISSEILLVSLGIYGVLGIGPGTGVWKVSTLPALLPIAPTKTGIILFLIAFY